MHRSPAMCSPRTYEEILADILDKRYSKCVCPAEYLTPPSKQATPCQFGPNCQFDSMHVRGPVRAATAPTCPYDASACTCMVQCTCGADALAHRPSPPQLQPPPKSARSPPSDCSDPWPRELEEDLLLCDPAECVCDRCECDPEPSSPRLLPGVFRSALRREGRRLMTDEEMREERAEMKRLMDEVSEPPPPPPPEPDEKERAKRKKSKEVDVGSREGQKESPKPPDSPKQSLKSAKAPKVSIVEPPAEEKKGEKRPSQPASSAKAPKRSKGHKHTAGPKPVRAAVQYEKRARTTELKRPPKIRYYYAGGVESYGVKLGHVNCLLKPVSVPKNMGWLWNIEDPSKGIRERKGWPPGFIGKNIKNMIKVMKAFASADFEGQGGEAGGALRRWRSQPDARASPRDEREEPPLLRVRKKGRTYDITFCPKASDDDIGPVPIPFSITQKPRDGESDTDESSLELEFHAPKPRLPRPPTPAAAAPSVAEEEAAPPTPPEAPPTTPAKGKRRKKKSLVSLENRNNWEDQPTHIENVASSTVAGS